MKKLLKSLPAAYYPLFGKTIVYMLQSTEYQPGPYLAWFWRATDFQSVMYRRRLVMTGPAKLLLLAAQTGMWLQYILSFGLFGWSLGGHYAWISLSFVLFLLTPILWGHLVVLPLILGRLLIINPRQNRQIERSKKAFKSHKAVKIAVAGSYGKTSMKEMLKTVLSQGKKVAATPANKNVSISHAIFARQLAGDEDVLIIEYGEGRPGDVERFTQITRPDIGVITGLAPAHLDKYHTLEQAGEDIFSLANYLNDKKIYVNADSAPIKRFLKPEHIRYSTEGAGGWKVSKVSSTIKGLSFSLSKGKRLLQLKSGLVGRHQIGPLAAVAALADDLGLTAEQIEAGVKKIESFEHRMQPREINGAWIIDDTYNGNIDGVKAGLALLKELKAARKIYVTPGLVDQGTDNQKIHHEIGRLIADAKPDEVVLMKHSVTPWIKEGIKAGNYPGKLVIEEDPLNFYNNLDQFVAAGDLILLQNDWPDQYS